MTIDENSSVVSDGVEMNNCSLSVAEARKEEGTLQAVSTRRTQGRRDGNYVEELVMNVPFPITIQVNHCTKWVQRFHLCHYYPHISRSVCVRCSLHHEFHSSRSRSIYLESMAKTNTPPKSDRLGFDLFPAKISQRRSQRLPAVPARRSGCNGLMPAPDH